MRVLLVKTSSLGDVIHNLPVASDIRRRFPEAHIDWVVEESFAAMPRLHPAVGRVLPVAVRRWRKAPFSPATWREIGDYRRSVRRPAGADQPEGRRTPRSGGPEQSEGLGGAQHFYDAVIDTQGLLKSALLAAQARGPKSGHAAASAREPLAARFYDRRLVVAKSLHAVERNRRLAAAALGYGIDDLPLDYGIAAEPHRADWLPAGACAVLLTATSRADKEWPEADWHALGSALNAAGLACVLPGGSPAERERAARIAATLDVAVAAPPMNLTELTGLMTSARIVVGVDTGLVHLAAALGRPTVAIYCGSDPALTGVLADSPHVNLGGPGIPPTAAEVVRAALFLLV